MPVAAPASEWPNLHAAEVRKLSTLLEISQALLAARQLNRRQGGLLVQVRAARTKLTDLLIGTATLLVIAGCIEGGFSQINEPTISYWFKIAVAAALFCALIVYVFIMPVCSEAGAQSSDLASK